jgi:transposase
MKDLKNFRDSRGEGEMLKVDKIERIRRAYYREGKSMRQIAREYHHSRHTIKKALASPEEGQYTLKEPREAPVLGPYKEQIKELLAENEQLPGKHRLTGHRIFQLLQQEGYTGSESGVRVYMWKLRQGKRKVKVYLPLEFEPGEDGQVDWGEAQVILNGVLVTVQIFVLRLCYSRKLFVMAFPTQKQECFYQGHVAAFDYFGGIPRRLSYDNLKTAVKRVLQGHNRETQERFILFRSHYLFESHFCTPGAGHEKGRVEDGVGYARRNFMTPLLQAADFDDLNEQLRQACLRDDQRRVDRQPQTIGEAWQEEKSLLRTLPLHPFDCCREVTARLNGYSQVEVETNRYSVPTERALAEMRVKLYPFEIKLYRPDEPKAVAVHRRCYGHRQDILEPLHYLPLLAQRPGALNHAKPIRQWRSSWPEAYERLLSELQRRQPDGAGVRQFIQVLQLHQDHPADLIEQAVTQALEHHCPHPDGVQLCLRQLMQPELTPITLDLSDQPKLVGVGQQPLRLEHYDHLLKGGQNGNQSVA